MDKIVRCVPRPPAAEDLSTHVEPQEPVPDVAERTVISDGSSMCAHMAVRTDRSSYVASLAMLAEAVTTAELVQPAVGYPKTHA